MIDQSIKYRHIKIQQTEKYDIRDFKACKGHDFHFLVNGKI